MEWRSMTVLIGHHFRSDVHGREPIASETRECPSWGRSLGGALE